MKYSPEPILEIDKLSIRRDSLKILTEISWRVLNGEHWVILGPNGSGKTSLLSALTGYLTPTKGEIIMLGERFGASDWRELRKRVGLVSSSVRQMMAEDETALEIVASGKEAVIDAWRKASPENCKTAMSLLRRLRCASIADRPWIVLSQGERQRVLIARALMAQPDVLILDEPCAGLDPAAREYFLRFINHLANRENSPSLVFVTHHVEEITPSFSHVLMLKNGRLLASGKKNTVMNSALLSELFSTPMRLKSTRRGYQLTLLRTVSSSLL